MMSSSVLSYSNNKEVNVPETSIPFYKSELQSLSEHRSNVHPTKNDARSALAAVLSEIVLSFKLLQPPRDIKQDVRSSRRINKL